MIKSLVISLENSLVHSLVNSLVIGLVNSLVNCLVYVLDEHKNNLFLFRTAETQR